MKNLPTLQQTLKDQILGNTFCFRFSSKLFTDDMVEVGLCSTTMVTIETIRRPNATARQRRRNVTEKIFSIGLASSSCDNSIAVIVTMSVKN